MKHPQHDAIASSVSGWYTTSTRRWYGYQSAESPTRERVILRLDEPDRVAAALAEAAAGGARALTIRLDDRRRAARLDPALRAAGCTRCEATTHLALVGPLNAGSGPDRLVVETVGTAFLEEWATVKLQSFDDSESAPEPQRLAEELVKRRSELDFAEFRIGRLDGAAVAVMAYFRGEDQMVFNLGTRVPYRNQGIAQAMFTDWVARGPRRSFLINAAEGGRAADLYRRLGFVDEVYWYRRYELEVIRP